MQRQLTGVKAVKDSSYSSRFLVLPAARHVHSVRPPPLVALVMYTYTRFRPPLSTRDASFRPTLVAPTPLVDLFPAAFLGRSFITHPRIVYLRHGHKFCPHFCLFLNRRSYGNCKVLPYPKVPTYSPDTLLSEGRLPNRDPRIQGYTWAFLCTLVVQRRPSLLSTPVYHRTTLRGLAVPPNHAYCYNLGALPLHLRAKIPRCKLICTLCFWWTTVQLPDRL
jgi:hypothetical protein